MSPPDNRPTWGILADDLTGAADAVARYADGGWIASVELCKHIGPPSGPNRAVARSTGARAAEPVVALRKAHAYCALLVCAEIDRLFVKVDSTIRGAVAYHVEGALLCWEAMHGNPVAVVCPAYPEQRRVVEGGRVYVNGTPARDESLADLFPGSIGIARAGRSRSAFERDLIQAIEARPRVVWADATDDDTLDLIAGVAVAAGKHVVPVGSAGLAAAIAGRARPARADSLRTQLTPPVLVVVTSRHRVAVEQVATLKTTREDTCMLVPPIGTAADERVFHGWVDEVRLPVSSGCAVVLVAPPAEASDDRLVVERSARLAARVVDRGRAASVILVGGDGAEAVLSRLKPTSLRVRGTGLDGAVCGEIELDVAGTKRRLPLVTKAGGFGQSSTLAALIGASR